MNNQEIVQQMYQAFGTGDMPAFFALLDETIVWNSHYTANIPLNGKFEKAEGIQTLLQTIGASVEIKAFAKLIRRRSIGRALAVIQFIVFYF